MAQEGTDPKRAKLEEGEVESAQEIVSELQRVKAELDQQKQLVTVLEEEKSALKGKLQDAEHEIADFQKRVDAITSEQVSKSKIHNFLGRILQAEPSSGVLVDIPMNEDDESIIVLGRPPVMGSSSKQMRHVTPYSFVKQMMKAAAETAQNARELLNNISQAVISFIANDAGIALKKAEAAKLDLEEIYGAKLVTSKNTYYFLDSEVGYKDVFTKLGYVGEADFASAFAKAQDLYLSKKKKFITFAMQNLQEALEDSNTKIIACEALARFIFTIFNQQPHTAFPDEGNSLNYEIRLYDSVSDARDVGRDSKAKEFSILTSGEVRQRLEAGEELNERIRIVDNEGSRVLKVINCLRLLETIIKIYNSEKDYTETIVEYNNANLILSFAKTNPLDDLASEFVADCNKPINQDSELAKQIAMHIAKLLYLVFDFRPLEEAVFVPATSKDLAGAEGEVVKVFPSANGQRIANYLVRSGIEYREEQRNAAKGYNKEVVFRNEDVDQLLLAKKVLDHIYITVKAFGGISKGFRDREESFPLEILQDFATIVAYDYSLDSAEFITGAIADTNKGIIGEMTGSPRSGESSESEPLEGATRLSGESPQAANLFDSS